jgi:hypothetical protein
MKSFVVDGATPTPRSISWTAGATRRILVMYRRPICKMECMMQAVSRGGEFMHCEVYCPDLNVCGTVGWTFSNFSLCDMMRTQACVKSYSLQDRLYTFHEILLSDQEFMTFVGWNEAMVKKSCKYNYTDLVLQILPKRITNAVTSELNKHDTINPKTLFCSQAVLLSLRNSTNSNHVIKHALRDLHTRLSTPSQVAEALTRVLGAPREAYRHQRVSV